MELVISNMKAKSKIFKGIEYVQISELPSEQREILSNSFNKNIIIKILVGGKILNDCIQFKDYVAWYENIFEQLEPQEVFLDSMINSSELVGKKS